jgi:hypothetical protein
MAIIQDEATAAQRRIPFALQLAYARNTIHVFTMGAGFTTGDTFTLTYAAWDKAGVNQPQETTGAIAWAADSSANIDAGLEALTMFGAGDITVVKTGGQETFTVTYATSVAGYDIPLPTLTPTGFTPTSVAMSQQGGPIGYPCRDATITAATDIQFSKNGGTNVAAGGTATNVGAGDYYYECTAAEVNTLRYVTGTVTKTGLYTAKFREDIEPATTEQGFLTFTATAATADSVTCTGLSAVNDFYKNRLAVIVDGTGEGLAANIHSYNGTTGVFSTEPAWVVTPSTDSVIELRHTMIPLAELIYANHQIAGTIMGEMATLTEMGDQVEAQIIDGGTPIIVSEDGGVSISTRRAT